MMRLTAVIVATITLAGCAKRAPLGEVAGTVTLAGKPLAGIQVAFTPDPEKHPDLPRSTGLTDDQGRYHLQCDDNRLGAVIGEHMISISDLHLDAPVVRRDSPEEDLPQKPRPRRFPTRYEHAATSPLRKQVIPGSQTIDLQLEMR
jgi:hypothetical protein